jgi:GAF domain-containing protein
MATAAWSTQQLAEFVAAISAAGDEQAAALAAVERAAEALDSDLAAIVAGGDVVAAVGCSDGAARVADLEAVKPGSVGSSLEVPGRGRCAAAAAALDHPPGSTLVVARAGVEGFTREEEGLLRGMARVASLTMRMQRLLDQERAARAELERLAREQTALRRVAVLVAEAAPAAEVFAAVAEEVGSLVPAADLAIVSRYDGDIAGEFVGTWRRSGDPPPVGRRFPLGGRNLHTLVFATGRSARVDDLVDDAEGTAIARELGARSSAGAPITVAGGLWGVVVVASSAGQGLPRGVEHRLAEFTELVATAIAKVQTRRELDSIAEEQAALRRVATLVAQGSPPEVVFAAVAEEVGQIVAEADMTHLGRYDAGAIEFLGGWTRDGGEPVFVGARVALGGGNVATLVFESGEPARVDHLVDDSSPATALAREWARSSAGSPISVDGRLWGAMIVSSRAPQGLADRVEHRLAGFTELAATAIANAQARGELRGVADEQAALRRVATLVARAEPPEAVFVGIAEELSRLYDADGTSVVRYETGGAITLVGSWYGEPVGVGDRHPTGGRNVTTLVLETGRPARVDSYDAEDQGAVTAIARGHGARSAVGAPIFVEGRLWGSLQLARMREPPLPAGTEGRLAAFAELAATAIANAQAREELRGVLDEQLALRRVATLVAAAAPPEAVFAAVAEEVGGLLLVEYSYVVRFDADDSATVVAHWGASETITPLGFRLPLDRRSVSKLVRDTGRAARIDDYAEDAQSLAVAAELRSAGIRSSAGAPIVVGGRPWGLVAVSSAREERLVPDTEARLADFTELVATAVANAQARADLEASRAEARRSAEEQAALRRVATLVAEGASPPVVFAAVAEEVGLLLSLDLAFVSRFEGDAVVSVAAWRATGETVPIGRRTPAGAGTVAGLVRETGRPARIDGYEGEMAIWAREFGIRSTVGAPITVGGRLWGFVLVASTSEDPLPAGTEEQLGVFTELVATAIANTQAQAELMESRARIVATADETRRRFERDLHDGAQQRLISLALKLRTAQTAVPRDLEELASELDAVASDLTGALDELREFARGIHPAILSEVGLVAAVKALARRSAVPVELSVRVDQRPAEATEVCAYYVVSEALANAAKHAEASAVFVDVAVADDVLRVAICDDGVGGATFAQGAGLVGLKDRVGALGGRISIESPPGGGTSIHVQLPLGGESGTR